MGEDGGRKERSKGGNALPIYKILKIDLKNIKDRYIRDRKTETKLTKIKKNK